MANLSLPNGESVFYADATTTYTAAGISSAEASSIAALMARRERWDYYWTNSAARTAETGMIQGSRGYQADTRTEYIYDNSAWRFALPYAEFTATVTGVVNNSLTNLGTYALDAAASSDATMVTPNGNGILRFVNAGVYSISLLAVMVNGGVPEAATGRTFLEMTVPPGYTNLVIRNTIAIAEDAGSVALPALRIASSNYDLQFDVFKNTATASIAVASRVRIARLA